MNKIAKLARFVHKFFRMKAITFEIARFLDAEAFQFKPMKRAKESPRTPENSLLRRPWPPVNGWISVAAIFNFEPRRFRERKIPHSRGQKIQENSKMKAF